MALNYEFRIPPGAADFVTQADYRFNQAALLYSLMPHMHLRGRSMRFEAEYPDGRREVLLDVPRYEFEWQNLYVLANPKVMPEGTVLHTTAHFDNSADNPNNPDSTRAVTFGEQTRNEMHVGYLNYAQLDQDLALGAEVAMLGPDPQGFHTAAVKLGPGAHEYKFLLSADRYRSDPGNPEQVGWYHNSLIRLGTSPASP